LVILHPVLVKAALAGLTFFLSKKGHTAERRSEIVNEKAYPLHLGLIYVLFLILIMISYYTEHLPEILNFPETVWSLVGITAVSSACGIGVFYFLSTFLLLLNRKGSSSAGSGLIPNTARPAIAFGTGSFSSGLKVPGSKFKSESCFFMLAKTFLCLVSHSESLINISQTWGSSKIFAALR